MLADEIDDKAVQQEAVIDDGVDPEVLADVNVVCGNVEDDGDEVIQDYKDESRNDCKPQDVSVDGGKAEVHVFGEEQQPEYAAEHVGEVQEAVAAVNENSGDGSGATVGSVGNGIENAGAEREKQQQLEKGVFSSPFVKTPDIAS